MSRSYAAAQRLPWGVVAMMLIAVAVATTSCDEDESSPAGFQATEGSGSESAGIQTAILNLGFTASSDATVSFATTGTASRDGDYTLLTTSPLTVAAGASTATIEFRIIDESIIEADDETITFSVSSLNGTTPARTLAYTYTIEDNDNLPATGLQVDLTWDVGTGVSIDTANLDLYLAYNVVVENNEVQSMDVSESLFSENTSGFENYQLSSGLKDMEYYIVVLYRSGSIEVPFTLGFSDATNGTRIGTGTFGSGDAGMAMFYGPIQKSGNSFSRMAAPSFVPYKHFRRK